MAGPSRRLRRLRWTWGFLAAVVVVGAWLGYSSFRARRPEVHVPGEGLEGITDHLSQAIPEGAPQPVFTDVTEEAGIRFESFAGPRSSQLPEDMGSGAAWGDFDADGDDDLFLVSAGGSLDRPADERSPSVLFENLGDGRFRRVDDFPDLRIVGMGAAWGDVDADGRLDLVVTGYRTLILLRNRDGNFAVDEEFPAPDGFWTGASWGDFDGDRDLDLYVCGYVRYREEEAERARESLQYGKSVPYTLNPSAYSPERNLLLRNDGTGGFVDVADELGVANPEGRSLGALWHDLDGNGWLDLYIANDISDNVLYLNQEGAFQDVSHAAWVADYRGAMGLAAGDWNADGDDDLFVTHWVAQENALYDSLLADLPGAPDPAAAPDTGGAPPPELRFMDVADERGLGQSALSTVGWGAEFADLDADGWLDLIVSNGSTFETADEPPVLEPQPMFFLWNRAGDGYHDLAPLSPELSTPRVGRGLAVADYDQDGDLDLVQVQLGHGVRLLRNDMETGHWVELVLRSRAGAGGTLAGRGEGALVVAEVGGRRLRRAVTGVSYLSQSSRTVHFGLGPAERVDELEVHWPGGVVEHYGGLGADRRWEIREGEPTPRPLGGAVAARSPGEPAALSPDARQRQIDFWAVQRAAVQAMKVDGDIERAAMLYQQALALDPHHEDSLYYLGNCLLHLGDRDGALESFRKLTEVNPSSHRGWRQWAAVRAGGAESAEELEEASVALYRALEINLEETGVLLLLGQVEILQEKLADAEQRLEWACRSNPRAVGGFFLLGYLAWKAGDPRRAEEYLATAHKARGPEWKPEGTVAEGDVEVAMHREAGLLSRFWESWPGTAEDPGKTFAALDSYLASRRRDISGG